MIYNLLQKAWNHHEVTYGKDAGPLQHKYDSVLMDLDDLKCKESLDYIFEIFIDKEDYEKQNLNVNILMIKCYIFYIIEKIENRLLFS